jgi:hypothetical protein
LSIEISSLQIFLSIKACISWLILAWPSSFKLMETICLNLMLVPLITWRLRSFNASNTLKNVIFGHLALFFTSLYLANFHGRARTKRHC